MIEKALIENLKERLEKERKTLEKELESFAKKDKALKGDWDTLFPNFKVSNLEEEADEVEEYENLLPVERALETKLSQINSALEKIKQAAKGEPRQGRGKYGICEKCNKEISEERLEVIPETKTCGQCK
jgi:RNA polymerase-binding transcription factor DksA